MTALRLVVTGCGASGTGWAARALTLAGLPCGHEAVYQNVGVQPARFEAESSWCAIPYLVDHSRVVRLVRNPLHVVRSALRLSGGEFLADHPTDPRSTEFVRRHAPHLFALPDRLARVVSWVACWDTPVAACPTVRVEDGPEALAIMLDVAGVTPTADLDTVCAEVGDQVNTHDPDQSIGWPDLYNVPYATALILRAAHLGYDLP